MKLRIVSGSLGRRFISVDKSANDFRPTQERVRIAVAEKIKHRIPEARVLDLCAGSGAFGIEMASRGAAHVDFVDTDAARGACIQTHVNLFNIATMCRVIRSDAQRFVLSCKETYDIVFYDPPYEDLVLSSLVPQLIRLVAGNGMLIYERKRDCNMPQDFFDKVFVGRETREYGDTAVDFLQPPNRENTVP
jgi:16S rRNA (guanine966-N2)-methyltransferase